MAVRKKKAAVLSEVEVEEVLADVQEALSGVESLSVLLEDDKDAIAKYPALKLCAQELADYWIALYAQNMELKKFAKLDLKIKELINKVYEL